MTASNANTISMNGNSTGYGISQGQEAFSLSGYYNTVLLAGASDTVDVTDGGFNAIDLNSTGFTSGTTDVINLGESAFNTVSSSNVLRFSDVTVNAIGGPNTISLDNIAGTTTLNLGNLGDPALQSGLGLGDSVTLNGDAANTVTFTSGGDATVAIGTAGDGQQQGVSTVSLWGYGNTVTGGDEQFTVTNKMAHGQQNSVSLGNGNNSVFLSGAHNTVHLGDGNNSLTMYGSFATATLGGGNNAVTTGQGRAHVTFASGHAGSTDTLVMKHGTLVLHGGDENFNVSSNAQHSNLIGVLGNGNNTISLQNGLARLTIGSGDSNTAHNAVTVQDGGRGSFTFNGGTDSLVMNGGASGGGNTIQLNGTMLGTTLSAIGSFNHITLTDDANAAISETGQAVDITLDADKAGGFGTISINGLESDDLARIHLVGASTYTLTADDTPVGGITLHFAQGSVDLIGLQSVPNHLFG